MISGKRDFSVATIAAVPYNLGDCDGTGCRKTADQFDDFLGLLDTGGLPESFIEPMTAMDRPRLEDFEGLTIAS